MQMGIALGRRIAGTPHGADLLPGLHALPIAHAEPVQVEVLGERAIVVPHMHGIAGRLVVRTHHYGTARDGHHRITDVALDVDAAMAPPTAAWRTELTPALAWLVGLVDLAIARGRPRQSAFARLRFHRLGAVALLFRQRELLRDGLARARVGIAGSFQLIRHLESADGLLRPAAVDARARLQLRALAIAKSKLIQRRLQGAHFFAPLAGLQHAIGQRRRALARGRIGLAGVDTAIGNADGGVLGVPVLREGGGQFAVIQSAQFGSGMSGQSFGIASADVVENVATRVVAGELAGRDRTLDGRVAGRTLLMGQV